MNAAVEILAVIELKHDPGIRLIAQKNWIINFKNKFNLTDTFLCYWSANLNDSVDDLECGYSKKFTGEPSLFKVFILKVVATKEEAEQFLKGRAKIVSKRFREHEDTDEALKKMEVKKRRSAKKELKDQKAQAQSINMKYFINEVQLNLHSKASTAVMSNSDVDSDEKEYIGTVENGNSLPAYQRKESNIRGLQLDATATIFHTEHGNVALEPNIDIVNGKAFDPKTSSKDLKKTNMESSMTQIVPPKISTLNEPQIPESSQELSVRKNTQVSSLLGLRVNSIELEECNSYDEWVNHVLQKCDEKLGPTFDKVLDQYEQPTNDSEMLNFVRDGQSNIPEFIPVNNIRIMNDISENEITNEEIIIWNLDDMKKEINDLKIENVSLKKDLENSNKRNLMLQNYLLEFTESVPETLFQEKDGGRLYRGGVFLNSKQCLVLDKSKSDRDYLNNLTTAIFGKEILKSHSVTGRPSNNTKGSGKKKLDEDLVQLIFEIMDARSVANKTKKLTERKKKEIIGKKCSNTEAAGTKKKKENTENQNADAQN